MSVLLIEKMCIKNHTRGETFRMEKTKLDCVVIIVNYNSLNYTIKAINSIIENEKKAKYSICVYDNNSSIKQDFDKIPKDERIYIIKNKKNEGYAKGNNNAIRFMKQKFSFDYIFIMNPDIELYQKNTLSNLIIEVKRERENIVGGQPCVWTYRYGDNPYVQNHIRNVSSIFDIFVLSFCINRLIYKKTWNKINYMECRPYNSNIAFNVPSGAFFFIKWDVFEALGLFDENTFLYNEELILGRKLDIHGYKLLFVPRYVVKHSHSASIESDKYNIRYQAVRYEKESKKILLEKYYKACKPIIAGIMFLTDLDYIIKKVIGILYKSIKKILPKNGE